MCCCIVSCSWVGRPNKFRPNASSSPSPEQINTNPVLSANFFVVGPPLPTFPLLPVSLPLGSTGEVGAESVPLPAFLPQGLVGSLLCGSTNGIPCLQWCDRMHGEAQHNGSRPTASRACNIATECMVRHNIMDPDQRHPVPAVLLQKNGEADPLTDASPCLYCHRWSCSCGGGRLLMAHGKGMGTSTGRCR
jgi:hypothetical protein